MKALEIPQTKMSPDTIKYEKELRQFAKECIVSIKAGKEKFHDGDKVMAKMRGYAVSKK